MIPWVAVDVLGGDAVRLIQGRREACTRYGPAEEALCRWAEEGATHFHLVDLAAAFGEPGSLRDLLPRVRRQVGHAVLQVAGGIRDLAVASDLVERGADRVVVGSALFLDTEEASAIARRFGGSRCVAALDVLEGFVRVKGWTEGTGETVGGACERAARLGYGEALVTDISRDGLLTSPNLDLYRALAVAGTPVIASGGIAERFHLASLAALPNVAGAVVGKALYEGRLTVKDLLEFGS